LLYFICKTGPILDLLRINSFIHKPVLTSELIPINTIKISRIYSKSIYKKIIFFSIELIIKKFYIGFLRNDDQIAFELIRPLKKNFFLIKLIIFD